MVDAAAFAPGRNLALTPGKVVHRNRLIELIQYAPSTETVHQIPLLIVPPWINKYYILDMQPKNSMVRYLVEQGFTVFVISWKNPGRVDGWHSPSRTTWISARWRRARSIREITGSPTINVMGYCIGGTLLAMTLAWLAAQGRHAGSGRPPSWCRCRTSRRSATPRCFMGEPSIDFIEQQMMERGYLDSREMSNMFNLLRSNDLIWANVVNNYLLGNKPPAFDLLYWNSDGTRMTRAAHSWYLRNTYVENNLIEPGQDPSEGRSARPRPDHARRLCGRGGEGPHRSLGRRVAHHAADERQGALCAGLQRSHRRDHQSRRGARGSTGSMLETGPPTRPRSGGRRARAMTAAGGRTGRAGWPSVRAAKATRRRWAARPIRRWTTRRDATCWRSDPDQHDKRPAVSARAEPAEVGGMESIPTKTAR